MQSIFEQMGGTYRLEGDYLLPNLVLSEEPEYQIGRYGRMRGRYLKEHRHGIYHELLVTGRLAEHLSDIDQICSERMTRLVEQMAVSEGVTEALKAANQMEWVAKINNIRSRAEEVVLQEVVFV